MSIIDQISDATTAYISKLAKPAKVPYNPTYWNDINIVATALGSGASAPDMVTLVGNMKGLAFDGNATTEQMYGSLEILHDYKVGTEIRPHIHWCPTTSTVGNVKWKLEYSIVNMDVPFPSATTTSVVCTTAGVVNTHQANEFPVIAGVNIGAIMVFRLFRDPTDTQDTYGSDAVLLSFGIHYEQDTPGSKGIFSKI